MAALRREVRRHFEDAAGEYFQNYSGEGELGRELRDRYLETLRPHLVGKAVLDVACGPGNFTHRVHREQKGQVVGLDFSRAMILIARKKYPGAQFLVADSRRLPFRDGTFHLSYSFRSLQHVPEVECALREIARVTARGGTVIIDYLNRWNPLGYLREKASRFPRFIFLKAHTRRTLERLCSGIGLRAVAGSTVQLLLDRSNLEKYLGRPPLSWLGWILRKLEQPGRTLPVLERFALRRLLVLERPESREALESGRKGS